MERPTNLWALLHGGGEACDSPPPLDTLGAPSAVKRQYQTGLSDDTKRRKVSNRAAKSGDNASDNGANRFDNEINAFHNAVNAFDNDANAPDNDVNRLDNDANASDNFRLFSNLDSRVRGNPSRAPCQKGQIQ